LSLRPGWYSNRAQATVSSYTSSTGTWDSVASMRTARLALATTTGLDGRIYSLGGTDSQSYFGSAETYDPEIDAWDAISPMPTARGWFASAAGLDGRIYAVGGRTNGGAPTTRSPSHVRGIRPADRLLVVVTKGRPQTTHTPPGI